MDLEFLLRHPVLQRARARVHETDNDTLREQVELVRIPAPPFGEAERAAEVRRRFGVLGLEDVEQDGVGNVLGRLPGPAQPGAAPVIVSAHLDTVFPAETDLTPRTEGDRILAPGIADNARGLAGMLAVARVLAEARLRTLRPLVFAATVGEEGIGDLRGVKHLFREGSPLRAAGAFVSLDGPGLSRVVTQAIGSRRLRVTVRGPGGHSWADRGVANPVQALGDAIAALGRVRPATGTRASLTVARIEGGTSVNTIPQEAWMELDLRADSPALLSRLEKEARAAVRAGVEGESRGRLTRTRSLACEVEVIGDRPSGETPAGAELVRAALATTTVVGGKAEVAASSTDANVPMALGIPAVTIGVGGEGGGVHTTGEWYANRGGALGVERALLLAVAVAGYVPASTTE
jgi:tripeptide aminopeptidase